MKKQILLGFLAVSILAFVPLSAMSGFRQQMQQKAAALKGWTSQKARVLGCAIPQLQSRLKCSQNDISIGRKWLVGISASLAVVILAAMGATAKMVYDAKKNSVNENTVPAASSVPVRIVAPIEVYSGVIKNEVSSKKNLNEAAKESVIPNKTVKRFADVRKELLSNVKEDMLTPAQKMAIKEQKKIDERNAFEQAKESVLLGVLANQLWMVQSALGRGARADTMFDSGPNQGRSILEIAAQNGNKEMVELILSYGALPEISSEIEASDDIKSLIKNAKQGRPSFPRRTTATR